MYRPFLTIVGAHLASVKAFRKQGGIVHRRNNRREQAMNVPLSTSQKGLLSISSKNTTLQKGETSTNHQFLGSMFNFLGVVHYFTIISPIFNWFF